jgi:hypothetical protein
MKIAQNNKTTLGLLTSLIRLSISAGGAGNGRS